MQIEITNDADARQAAITAGFADVEAATHQFFKQQADLIMARMR